ncbi:MAG: Ig-like domain-containing protein [Pseudomonadota bacterium]
MADKFSDTQSRDGISTDGEANDAAAREELLREDSPLDGNGELIELQREGVDDTPRENQQLGSVHYGTQVDVAESEQQQEFRRRNISEQQAEERALSGDTRPSVLPDDPENGNTAETFDSTSEMAPSAPVPDPLSLNRAPVVTGDTTRISSVPTGGGGGAAAPLDIGFGANSAIDVPVAGQDTTSASQSDQNAPSDRTETAESVIAEIVPKVADAPVLQVGDVVGAEDNAIALDIRAALDDRDGGSETLSVTISGVPEGATLSAGTDNGNGTWSLSANDLAGLTLTPPENFSGDFTLTIIATSTESNGSTHSVTADMAVDVTGVADGATLAVENASGSEDSAIALAIDTDLLDGSENISVTISGVPDGATLSAGTNNGDGNWILNLADLNDLTLTPPTNYSGNFDLTISVTTTDGADSAVVVDVLRVEVTGIADTPTLDVSNASGTEDSAITLDIDAALSDASEVLSITIGNVPDGATLSAGTNNGDGSWSLTPDQLSGLTITPPADYSGSFDLSVTATSIDGEDVASVSDTITVDVAGVADVPILEVENASGAEDSAIALDIDAALGDVSEVLSITIGNVPDGATLSAGADNGNGSWTLSPTDFDGLTITPPTDYSGSFDLSVTATSVDGEDIASVSDTITVDVAGVADAPILEVGNASGAEDTAIALDIDGALTDSSEVLSISISGVPDGAVLSAGTNNGDGSWSLTPNQLSGLTITPPADYSGSFDLGVTATSVDGEDVASVSDTITVDVAGVAGAPTLDVSNASGAEDSAITLDIDAALTDASEVLSITIGNVPDGATLSAGTNNGDGSWSLTPDQLSGLTITPPSDYSGSFDLSVTASSVDGEDVAAVSDTITVDVVGVADTPTLDVSNASGAEDSAIALDIDAALTDSSEVLRITIGNVPDGATLSAGTDNGDGSWSLMPGQLSGLTIAPPADYSGSFDLSVTATSVDGEDVASVSDTITVDVAGVADAPILEVGNASGAEDTAISLDIDAALTDSSEVLNITIGNVPDGAVLSAGTNNGDGSWSLTPDQLSGLTITPPSDYSGSFDLSVTATSVDGEDIASVSDTITVDVAGVADAPTLDVADASGVEDSAITLDIDAALTDVSEVLSITIGNVPEGAILSAGTNNGDGSWSQTPDQLSGLTITPPSDYSGSFDLSVTASSVDDEDVATVSDTITVDVAGVADAPTLDVTDARGLEDSAIALDIDAALTDSSEVLRITIGNVPDGATLSAGTDNGDGSWSLTPDQLSGLTITPPADYSGSFDLSVTATSVDGEDVASVSDTITVDVVGVADAPTLDVADASVAEDSAITLDIDAALTDASEVLGITISGVPDGAVLSAGSNNGDGSWSLTPDQLSGLAITPPEDYSGSFNLSVTATSVDGEDVATVSDTITVDVAGVADAPILEVGNASGTEDTAIALDIDGALTDSSEVLSISISGVPDGAVLSAGTNNGDGSWSLTPDQLSGLTITPPENYSGSFNLSVTATSVDGEDVATVSDTITVDVAGVADAPTFTVGNATGTEGSAIALDIDAALGDVSEVLSITIGNVPDGATLSAGADNGNGSWTLSPTDLDGLTITPPTDYSGSFDLSVTATSVDGEDVASVSETITVDVAGVADAPILEVENASGAEDSAIALNIDAALTDASEVLSITISGVPDGAVLSAGTNNGDGSWSLTPDQLSGLTITPPEDYSGSFNLSVTATSADGEDVASVSDTITVDVAGVADAPTLAVGNATGTEDSAIALDIDAALGDVSEILSITIGNAPDGATLSAGTNNGDGSWSLTPDQLSGLTITPPTDYSGSFDLSVRATSVDGEDVATVSDTITVDVAGVADAPILEVENASGAEDTAIALDIDSALTDVSEVLSITIGNVPEGAILSAGTNNGDGSWSLTPDQLSGLTITPPTDYSGSFDLSVTATSVDGEDVASVSDTITVDVAGVADAPILEVGNASGAEDTAIALDIDGALTDSSEVLSISISGVPDGTVLSAGTNNGDGSWSLTPDQLSGLTIMPPADYSGSFDLSVTVTSVDGEDVATVSDTITVDVAGVADAPVLGVGNASGAEDTAIALDIDGTLTDSSEVLSISISGVPDGAVLSVGTNNGDGSWSLTPNQLSGLTITPPADYSGSFDLSVTATSVDGEDVASVSDTITVDVAGVADAPTLDVTDARGSEDSAIALDIDAALTDSSEVLSITIGNVPDGATLSAGTDNGDGSWSLTPDQLSGLTITPPTDYSGSFDLSVTATSVDGDDIASVSDAITVDVVGVADTPTLDVADASGAEDSAITLDIDAALTDVSEVLSITIGNVPDGATLSAGTDNGNGSWTLSPTDLDGLTITPPADYSGSFDLSVTATSVDGEDVASVSETITVDVAGVADAPTLDVSNASGAEDSAITLDVDAGASRDPSETLSITISGVPDGAILSAGIDNGDGSWSLALDDLAGLSITPVGNYSGSMDLTVTVTSRDGDDVNSVSDTITVVVTPVADAPELSAEDATATTGSAIALDIDAALTDPDEVLSITISGVPDGASLSAGTDNGDGSWSLTPQQLAGLSLIPVANYVGSFELIVVAQSRDGTDTATTTAILDVTIEQMQVDPGQTYWGDYRSDTITAGSGDDIIYAGEGHNTISAGAGDDYVFAGSGHDVIDAIGGDNLIYAGEGKNTVTTGSGNDTIYAGSGDDIINAGDGDNIIYAGEGKNSVVTGSGDDFIQTGSRDDYINAGDGNNRIQAGEGKNVIITGSGDDSITAGSDNDTVFAGDGNDVVDVGNGKNTVWGAGGDDSISGGYGNDSFFGGEGDDFLTALGGDNYLDGGAGNDTLNTGWGRDTLYGGDGDDTLDGGGGDDTLHGGGGDDVLIGGAGNDILVGEAGDDTLYGGDGNDTLYGGIGNDEIYGGGGSDLFIFGMGDGSDYFDGGKEGWSTDTIELRGANDSQLNAGDWTLTLDDGSITKTNHNYLELSSDSSGTIVFSDGSELTFSNVERIEW